MYASLNAQSSAQHTTIKVGAKTVDQYRALQI